MFASAAWAHGTEGLDRRVQCILDAPLVGDVCPDELRAVPDLRGRHLPGFLVDVGEHDVRPVLGEEPGGGRPELPVTKKLLFSILNVLPSLAT